MKTEIFGFKAPGNVCQDKKCPFHGEINVKKELLKGTVIKKDVNHSATISWFSPNFLPKYERFESRKSKLRVHNPACLDVPVGTAVVVAKTHPLSKTKHHIILGIVGLIVGGKWIVDGAVEIAKFFNISESLIGLTIIAIGTSLPELATSAVAAYKKQSDIAIGNIVGSNIFNIFFVLGVSAIIRPLPFNDNLNKDIAMTIFASVILLLMMFIGKKRIIKRWQGIFMIIVYIGYIVFLVWSK